MDTVGDATCAASPTVLPVRAAFGSLECVLFDLDDTLLDHRGAARDALVSWNRTLGIKGRATEMADRWHRLETTYYSRFQQGELTKIEQRRARVREFCAPAVLTDDDADAAFEAYWSAYADSWRPFPDALPTLRRAQGAGLVVGILTNGDGEDQRSKANSTGLDLLGIPLFASSELLAAKPDARAFTGSCALLGVQPAATLMVGDSPENDVAGARAAGMSVILLDRYGRYPHAPVPRIGSLAALRFK